MMRRGGVLAGTFLVLAALVAVPGKAAPEQSGPGGLAELRADSRIPPDVRRSVELGAPLFVSMRVPVGRFSDAASPAARGRDFWESYGRVFGVKDPAADLRLAEVERDDLGMTHLRYDERYRGLPVFGHQLLLHLRNGTAVAANGDFAPVDGVSTTPRITGSEARARAIQTQSKRGFVRSARAPELVVYPHPLRGPRLAWDTLVGTAHPLGLWRSLIDAMSGETLLSYNDLRTAKDRTVYDGGNDPDCSDGYPAPFCTLPGTLERDEDGPASADTDVEDAFANAGLVYDYYSTAHLRDSYDAAGHTIRSTVHFGVDFNNAFWCPSVDCADVYGSSPDGEQMVYGDGDGVEFSPLGGDLDVVAHELTHAVTEKTADLLYFHQSGALNESYSDVFAAMIDPDTNGHEWLIGEDSYTPGTPGDALRSMEDPTLFGQPDHLNDYVHLVSDGGGVHVNSGIPNHAAYLLSEDPGYGIGRAEAEDIYYRALTSYLTPTSDFLASLNALIQSAEDIFGAGSPEVEAVVAAHAEVGVVDAPTVTAPNGGETFPPNSATNITWSADGTDGLGFSVEYGTQSPPDSYTQGFEAGPSLPAGFAAGGDDPWAATTTSAHTGVRSISSAASLLDNELSTLSLTRYGSSISFWARMESEEDFDYFMFFVDTVPLIFGSGNIPWSQPPTVTFPAGYHTFTWIYEKDDSVAVGADRVWVDDIMIANSPETAFTSVNPLTAPDATSQAWTTPSAEGNNYVVRVSVPGSGPMGKDLSNAPFTVGLRAKSVSLKAKPKKVEKGEKTRLTATVSPCAGHEGDTIEFYRGSKKIAARPSNSDCVGKLKLKMKKTATFQARSPKQDDVYGEGVSNKVKVKVI